MILLLSFIFYLLSWSYQMIIKNCKCYNSKLLIYYVQLNMQFVIDYMWQELHCANLTFYFYFLLNKKNEVCDVDLSTQCHMIKMNNITCTIQSDCSSNEIIWVLLPSSHTFMVSYFCVIWSQVFINLKSRDHYKVN